LSCHVDRIHILGVVPKSVASAIDFLCLKHGEIWNSFDVSVPMALSGHAVKHSDPAMLQLKFFRGVSIFIFYGQSFYYLSFSISLLNQHLIAISSVWDNLALGNIFRVQLVTGNLVSSVRYVGFIGHFGVFYL